MAQPSVRSRASEIFTRIAREYLQFLCGNSDHVDNSHKVVCLFEEVSRSNLSEKT